MIRKVVATKIAKKILNELSGRNGYQDIYRKHDPEIIEQIISSWTGLILKGVNNAEKEK